MNSVTTQTGQKEPVVTIELDGNQCITILGTAHISRASADKVRELLATGDYDAVAVELCPSRHNAILDPDSLARMDLFEVIRKGKVPMVTASLALGAYQQRMAEQFDIEPGAEMKAAIECARNNSLPVLLIDREIGITLKRISRNVPWWKRFHLFSGLIASLISSEKVTEEEIERLKEGDILETTFAQFADQEQDLFKPLIDERDLYMAARLIEEVGTSDHRHILAVVGAGHMRGIQNYLRQLPAPAREVITELDQLPAPSRWPKLIPWLIVALVLIGFTIGFMRSPELGWQMVADWVLINGGLAALGAAIAMAHPLTVMGAFLAAPLTSLNPTVGAGMVTAAIETWLRKPTVNDFSKLRKDVSHLKGWWHNRVARIFLVFILSTLGSAVGTYLAGFRIFGHLSG